MRARRQIQTKRAEEGVALLISIFILLLISVVAIALIISSGTESALAGNYRSATGVYYASLAGMEEARGRLLSKNASSFKNTWPSFPLAPGPLPIGTVGYVLNPGPTEAMGNILTTYPEKEYDNEFGSGALAAATVMTTASVWNGSPLNGLPFPGPLYKWVRINAVSEVSLRLQVAPYGDGHAADPAKPIFYDGTQLNVSSSGSQVLEITSLAVLPNSSQKLLQYLVAPIPFNFPNIPAAVTLVGNNVNFNGPNSTLFKVDGSDHDSVGSCTPGSGGVTGIGYTNTSDSSASNIKAGNVTAHQTNYTGTGGSPPGTTPNVYPVTLPSFQKPSDFNALVQVITQNSDVVIAGPATGSGLTAATTAMSSSNPMTVVVNGDLDLNAWNHTGYGLLLVTGNLNYDPDATWYGIVLVIGKGTVTGTRGGNGQFDGAMLVAKIFDASGNLLPDPNLGASTIAYSDAMGGKGHYYSSCWIQAAMPSAGYRVLSFHEISQ